ncbi:MAG: hypothetical protein ACXVJG_10825 [Mucilaginibacter sp.]
MKILLGIVLITVGMSLSIVQIKNFNKNSYITISARINMLFAGIGFIAVGIIAIIKAL